MVRLSPSLTEMLGFHPNFSIARPMSGRRRNGSSVGNGLYEITDLLPRELADQLGEPQHGELRLGCRG